MITTTYRFRSLRLAHGWDLDGLALRLKFVATLRGVVLPPVGLLRTWVFLWENGRTEVPRFYDELLTATFALYARPAVV